MLAPLAGALTPLVSNVAGVSYLLGPFRFTTDQAAPLTSPYTEAGAVGSLTITDTTNKVSVAGGELFVQGGIAASFNPGVTSGSLVRATGRGLLFDARITAGRLDIGWANTPSASYVAEIELISGLSAQDIRIPGASSSLPPYNLISGTQYPLAIILRSSGAFWILNGLLWWVHFGATNTPLYVTIRMYGSTSAGTGAKTDNLRVTDLPAPWNTDYGIATNRTASPSAGASTTMEANALVEFAWTAATGATLELDVRRTDASNRWIVRGSQAGSTIKLIECNAGVETERSSAAQTWTNGTSYRVVVLCDGTTIRTYVANALKNSYTSASFNQSATGVRVSHAGTNLVTWPRTLSGTALSTLQAV